MFYLFLGGIITSILTSASQDEQNQSAKEINEILAALEEAKLAQEKELTEKGLALKEKELGLLGEKFEAEKQKNIMELLEKRKGREFEEKTTKIGVAGGFRGEQSDLRDKLTSFWGRMMPQRRAA